MCSLCGAMGVGRDWADEASATSGTPTLERQHRLTLANEVLAASGLSVRQWGGRYVVAGRTGRSGLVDNLSSLWPLADRLGTAPLDPLDENLLDRLEARLG
jgi:hypothetical protein